MDIRSFHNKTPKIDASAYIDKTACIIGDVTLGKNCSVWPYVVIRGDLLAITIGNNTNIQDGSILHTTRDSQYNPHGFPLSIGSNVTIGHKVLLHGCTIHDLTLVGMGSTVIDGAVIESNVILGANSLVPPGKVLESGYLWLGQPAKKIRPLTEDELKFLHFSYEGYVALKNQYIK